MSVTTGHYKIANYWKNYYIDKDGTLYSTDKTPFEDIPNTAIRVIDDFGEPVCWACGKPIICEKEDVYQQNGEFNKIWNDKDVTRKFNRCHIIPNALGGKDEPSNLFLMCHSCHVESPDTKNASSFFRWVYQKKSTYANGKVNGDMLYKLVDEEIKSRNLGVTLADILETFDILNIDFTSEDFKKFTKEHIGMHTSYLSTSSIVCGTADYLLKLILERSLSDVA